MAGGGIKRIGSTGARALSLNSRVAHQPSRQGLLKISNLSFPVVTAWETYTPALTNFTTSSLSGVWRRVGDSMQVKMQATLNGAATGTLAVGIPAGYLIDTTKIFTNDEVDFFGTAILRDTGTENEAAFVVYRDTTTVQMRPSEGEINLVGTAVPFTWASGDRLGMKFEIPIQGWDANGTGSIEEIIESSFFNLNAANSQAVQNVASADFTAFENNRSYFFTTGAANRNLNLPAAAANAGVMFFCQKVDTGTGYVYIDPNGAELINGFSRVALHLANEGITFVSDGTAWRIVGYNSSNYATWTPSFTAASPMTYTSVAITLGQWRKISIDAVEMRLIVNGTTGGTASNNVRFSPPIVGQSDEFNNGCVGNIAVLVGDSGARSGTTQWGTATSISVFKFDISAWGLGASKTFNISGTYRTDPAA